MQKENRAAQGLTCPHCGCTHHHVLYTRAKGNCILRRKECRHCGRRMFTREVISDNTEALSQEI